MSLYSLCRASAVSIAVFLSVASCGDGAGGGDVTKGTGGEGEGGGSQGGETASGGSAGTSGNTPMGGAGPSGQGGAPIADAGQSSDDGGSVSTPPVGLVPMFVAAGNGGRTITSCDDGLTWVANQAYENANVDHSPNTEKGFAYGNGLFIELIGWGAAPSAKVSRNGIDWKRVTVPKGDGGLIFVSAPVPAFFAVGGYGGCSTSTDGETWKSCKAPNYNENLREGGGGGSILGVGGDIAAQFSFDGGKSWKGGGPCTAINGFGNLGQEGGFAFGNKVFAVVTSRGDWCQTADAGVSWKTGKLGGNASGKMSFAKDRFWAPNGRDVSFSDDGLTWKRETFKPATVTIHSMARGDSGTYVGVDRSGGADRFFRSTDGLNWVQARGAGGTSLRRVVFGYGQPSQTCPLH